MATRSTIAARFSNGKIFQSYVHWDGHLDTAGKTLLENWNTQEKVESLINLGALSELGERLGEKLPFGQRDPGGCVAYMRDKGYTAEECPETFETEKEFTEAQQQFNYFWDGARWICAELGGPLTTENTKA